MVSRSISHEGAPLIKKLLHATWLSEPSPSKRGLVAESGRNYRLARQLRSRVHRFRLLQKNLKQAGEWVERHQAFWTGAVDQLERLLKDIER